MTCSMYMYKGRGKFKSLIFMTKVGSKVFCIMQVCMKIELAMYCSLVPLLFHLYCFLPLERRFEEETVSS